jgi:hypoxanthine phosphoribosyltransferase
VGAPAVAPIAPPQADVPANGNRLLPWEGFHAAVKELGRQIFADSAYGGFRPDAVVGVNHGGAIAAGLLFYVHQRTFEFFTITCREEDWVSGPEHLQGLTDLADSQRRPIRVLLVDDSMKTGASFRLARANVEQALADRPATLRTAVVVYRRDYHERAGSSVPAPDYHVHTDIDLFPYGPV